ncbi:FBD-associated F-box protein [Camellia lanceoleosa]|nr:FBD-associated F-box protein [Camellia lanceoleosa]
MYGVSALLKPLLFLLMGLTRYKGFKEGHKRILVAVLGCAEDIGQLTLWNLTRLELGVIYLSKVMLDLLSKMPNLESLKLIMDYECYFGNDEEKEFYRIQWHAVPCCLLSHLKVIEIDNFRGRENDLLLVEYFLKNAKVLNKMAKI